MIYRFDKGVRERPSGQLNWTTSIQFPSAKSVIKKQLTEFFNQGSDIAIEQVIKFNELQNGHHQMYLCAKGFTLR